MRYTMVCQQVLLQSTAQLKLSLGFSWQPVGGSGSEGEANGCGEDFDIGWWLLGGNWVAIGWRLGGGYLEAIGWLLGGGNVSKNVGTCLRLPPRRLNAANEFVSAKVMDV